MENRQQPRAKMSSTEVHVSDRAGFCTGTLKNFSRSGLCITDLPRRIHPEDDYFTVIVSRGSMNYNLEVQEKWEYKSGLTNEVGVTIDNAPIDWTSMVQLHEPPKNSTWRIH